MPNCGLRCLGVVRTSLVLGPLGVYAPRIREERAGPGTSAVGDGNPDATAVGLRTVLPGIEGDPPPGVFAPPHAVEEQFDHRPRDVVPR